MLLAVSRTLQRYLTAAIPEIRGDWVQIGALSADQNVAAPPANTLVLFLHSVSEHPHMRNAPMTATAGGYRRAPMGLTLSYLVTYTTQDATTVQQRLALVLQAFHTSPRLGRTLLEPELVDRVDALTVRLRSLTTDDANKLWTALGVGMRLSLHYEVDIALIDPTADIGAGPVRDYELRFAEAT